MAPPPPPRSLCLQLATLPLRLALHAALLALLYALVLPLGAMRALYQRCCRGRASRILRQPAAHHGPGYALQLVVAQPLDPQRLRVEFLRLAGEGGVGEEACRFVVEAQAPSRDFAPTGAVEADHYVGAEHGAGRNWVSGAPFWALNAVLGVRLWNGAPDEPTVLHVYLSGSSWDGSSCFNFLKELVARYCGDKPQDVFRVGRELALSGAAQRRLDARPNFAWFLLLALPANLALNLHSTLWRVLEALLAGPGLGVRVTCINFDEVDSGALVRGLKEKGAKPFAALSLAAVQAFAHVFGRAPANIAMPASLATRGYEPLVPERNLVGDWVVAPLQRVPRDPREYTLERAQRGYEALLGELKALNGAVARACEAKAFGFALGGAAVREALPAYNDANRLLDSCVVNNYGVRSLHPAIHFVSYNSAAPVGLGLSCICINGRTSITLASSVLSLDELRCARDKAHEQLRSLMDGGVLSMLRALRQPPAEFGVRVAPLPAAAASLL